MNVKPKILLILIAAVGLALFIESGALDAVVMFLLVGAIPGTPYSVPPAFMLLLTVTSIWMIFFRFTVIKRLYSVVRYQASKAKNERKKRMPRRRFGQI